MWHTKPQVLFEGNFVGPDLGEGTPWDISRDGKHCLMIKPPISTNGQSASQPHRINIVLNWLEELKQCVPVK